jgi:hypothetical protein
MARRRRRVRAPGGEVAGEARDGAPPLPEMDYHQCQEEAGDDDVDGDPSLILKNSKRTSARTKLATSVRCTHHRERERASLAV